MATNDEEIFDSAAELARFDEESDKSLQILLEHGFVPDTAEWLTIKRYAQKHNVTIEQVTDWIESGVIPADCIQDIPVHGGIRVIKDIPFSNTTTR